MTGATISIPSDGTIYFAKPSLPLYVGSIVHYAYDLDGGCVPAIVMRIHEDRTLHLLVFSTGHYFEKTSVPRGDGHADGTWHHVHLDREANPGE